MRVLAWPVLGSLVAAPAFAQGASSTSTLSGDRAGQGRRRGSGRHRAVKNDATASSTRPSTNTSGRYSVPAIEPARTPSRSRSRAFKTFVHNDVRLLAAQSVDLTTDARGRAAHRDGEVKGDSELVRDRTPRPSARPSTREFITSLPRADRNALNFLIFLPGVETSAAPTRADPRSAACRRTRSTSRSTASTPATTCSRVTGSSRSSCRAWTRSKK